jgi:hypothetical protein
MKTRERRLGILALACVVGLIATGAAFAAINPSLAAITQVDGTVISYTQGQSDDPAALVSIYVPAEYTALLAQADGTVIGTVEARALATDLNNTILPLTGSIVVGTAATTVVVGGSNQTLGALATACTGTATHTAFWVLNLTASGQTLQVPAYVDDIPFDKPFGDFATDKIAFCLPPPDVPQGTPGRATLGAKLLNATLKTDNFSAPPGVFTWHATVTPYSPGTGKANAAGTVEVQSTDRTPQSVTIAGKPGKKSKTAVVSGKVVAGGQGVSGASVSILRGKTAVAKVTTKAGGAYSATVKLNGAAALSASAVFSARAGGTCTPAFGVPCSGNTAAGFSVASKAVRVKSKK